MRVAYKWAITSTKVAYITGSGEQFNEPYICDNGSCADNDESVANLASLMTEAEYKANFEKMVVLLKNDEDGKYYSLYPYDYYFNAEDNECLSTIDTGITINTQVSVKTLECDQEATVNIITAGTKDSQTVSFEFSIPKGCQGPQGPRGASGSGTTAGDSYRTFFIYKSSDTNPDTPTGGSFTVNQDIDGGGVFEAPDGWSTDSDLTGVVWMSNATYNVSNGDRIGNWSTPIRLTGESGGKGRLIYPAGIYDPNKTYTTDEHSAPYVLDTSDSNFYVLNAQMTWDGTVQGKTPSESYAESGSEYWLKFDAFEAIYTKVGIIANGLIGSAVFNGDYMFSQEGIDASGNSTDKYQNFNPTDPFNENNSFIPQICINFKTGEAWFAHGLIHFSSNGMEITTSGGTKTSLDGMYDSIQGVQGDVSGLTETVSNYSTKIEQNAEAIKLKADFTTVESLQTDVADLYTNVGTLNNKITSNTTAIEANAQQIALKASKEEVTNIENRLGDAESTIAENTAAIQLNANEISSVVSKQEKVGVEYSSSDFKTGKVFTYYGTLGDYAVIDESETDYKYLLLGYNEGIQRGDKIHIENLGGFLDIIIGDTDRGGATNDYSQESGLSAIDHQKIDDGTMYCDGYLEYYSNYDGKDAVDLIVDNGTGYGSNIYIALSNNNPTAYQSIKVTLIKSAYTAESRIKQTATEIELKVKDCGINIDEKKITLTANNTIVDGTLSVQQVNSYYPNGSVKSSFNGQGNGTITYYYPITPDSAVTETNIYGQVMKSEYFVYDDDGNVRGITTCCYRADGTIAWEITEDGTLQKVTQNRWRVYKADMVTGTTELKLSMNALKDIDTSDPGKPNLISSNLIKNVYYSIYESYTGSTYNGCMVLGNVGEGSHTDPEDILNSVSYVSNFCYCTSTSAMSNWLPAENKIEWFIPAFKVSNGVRSDITIPVGYTNIEH